MGEESTSKRNISKKMSLILGARRHLEWGHEKYIMDTIQSHPAQVLLVSIMIPFTIYLFGLSTFVSTKKNRQGEQCSNRD